MKISSIFIRRPSRQRRRPVQSVDLIGNWTTRDWSDLPVHHPRQD